MSDLVMQTGADFSADRTRRTLLWRIWDASLPLLCIVGMNPSKASETDDDPTSTRGIKRSMLLGFGGLLLPNVFDLIETDSRKLITLAAAGVVLSSPENDAAIICAAKRAGMVICGWGKPGELHGRGHAVLAMLRDSGIVPYALAINADGSPKHPLYVGYDVQPKAIL